MSPKKNIYLTGLPGSGKTSIAKALSNRPNINSFTMSEKMLQVASRIYNVINRDDFGKMTPVQRNVTEELVWKKHIENNNTGNTVIDGHLNIIHKNTIQPTFPYEKFKHIDLVVYIDKTIEHIKNCIQERNTILQQQGGIQKKEYSNDELSSLDRANKGILERLQNNNKDVIIISPQDRSLDGLIESTCNEIFMYLWKKS